MGETRRTHARRSHGPICAHLQRRRRRHGVDSPVGTAAEPEVLDADRQPTGQPKALFGRVFGKSDLLQAYLTEIRQHPILDREEEKDLAMQYLENQDPDAAKQLVTSNLRLVVKLAFQYHRQWSNVLDLIQEGNMGPVEALSRYDPYRGIRFSSYAQYWIRRRSSAT